MGLEGFDPFHTMHYEQSQSAHVKWLEIFRGSLQERKKLGCTFNFRNTFWAASFTSAARGGWCVFVAPPEKRVL